MVVHDKPLSWYIEKIKNNEYFSQGMYGDGEWLCMLGDLRSRKLPIGTDCTNELCDKLEESLHFSSDNYFFCSGAILKNPAWSVGEKRIDGYLAAHGLEKEFYEKEVWDLAMKSCELQEFWKFLKGRNVAFVGNKYHRGLTFLYNEFFEIGFPNCFTDGSLWKVRDEILSCGKPGVYLVSGGLAAALLTQSLHGKIPQSWFLDLGSIWDVFVGLGEHRGFRGALYENAERLREFLSLSGIEDISHRVELIYKNLEERCPGKYANH